MMRTLKGNVGFSSERSKLGENYKLLDELHRHGFTGPKD
jgi:hypothetical protein